MKRTLSVFLCGVLSLLLLAGCAVEEAAVAESGTAEAEEPASANEAAGDVQSGSEEPAVEEELPDNDWEFDLPENHGVDSARLAALHDALREEATRTAANESTVSAAASERTMREAGGPNTVRAVVTVKDGFIIDEYYHEDYDADSVFRLASCSKTFSGALIGLAIEEGLIDGVDAELSEYFPQLADSGDAYRQEITIEHLLTHTSGIQWNEWNGGSSFGTLARSENWVEHVLSQPMASQPGTVFNYTTGGSHLLAAVLQEAAGQTAYAFAQERLFTPLGMDSVQWRADPQGVTDGGNGIAMTARDAAKFGQLYLDGGKWRGEQVLPQSWVEQSTQVQSAGTGGRTGQYGYQWWIRPFGEREYDTYFAMGHGGQYIFVVPELQLVTVLTGRFDDTYAPWPYFTDSILAACG